MPVYHLVGLNLFSVSLASLYYSNYWKVSRMGQHVCYLQLFILLLTLRKNGWYMHLLNLHKWHAFIFLSNYQNSSARNPTLHISVAIFIFSRISLAQNGLFLRLKIFRICQYTFVTLEHLQMMCRVAVIWYALFSWFRLYVWFFWQYLIPDLGFPLSARLSTQFVFELQ